MVKAKYLFTSSSMPSFSLSWRNWSRAYLTKYEYGIDLKIDSHWTSWETAKRFWKGRPFQEEFEANLQEMTTVLVLAIGSAYSNHTM